MLHNCASIDDGVLTHMRQRTDIGPGSDEHTGLQTGTCRNYRVRRDQCGETKTTLRKLIKQFFFQYQIAGTNMMKCFFIRRNHFQIAEHGTPEDLFIRSAVIVHKKDVPFVHDGSGDTSGVSAATMNYERFHLFFLRFGKRSC